MPAVLPACEIGVVRSTKPSALCRPDSRPWVIAAASLGSGMAFLDSTIMNVALPAVQAELGASAREVQWSYGAFALVLSALILVGGTLGDRFGRRRLFVVGAAIFGAASLWCALDRPGGWLVDYVSWRAAFLLAPAMAVVAIPIALSHVPESQDPDARGLDLAGAILATGGLAGVVYALIESSARGFGDSRVLAALVLGLIAFSVFVLVEQHARHPMVPPSLFHSRSFTGANLVTLLFYMALTGSLFFLPFLMMQVHGYSAFVAGSVFLPFVAMALLIGRFSGRISARFGAKVPLIVASLAVAAGLLLFALPGAEHGSYWISFFPAMVVQGFGMALAITPMTTVALGSVEGEHSGMASGVNNAVARVAGLLAVAVLGGFIYGAFSSSLDTRMEDMDMPGEVRIAMEAAKADLGAAEAPASVNDGMEAQIEHAIDESFVAGFRAVMLASAGLALASALIAALLVGDPRTPSTG